MNELYRQSMGNEQKDLSEEERSKQKDYAKRKGNEGGMNLKKDMSDEV